MRPIERRILISPLAISLHAIGSVLPAAAQDRPAQITPSVGFSSNPPAALTGKERLGRKWLDEQRIDNCNVPTDKRGIRPRPSACTNGPAE
jgi:hypothetical protein